MAKAKVMVTTTPNIEGWEIESYLGPISSHIVAGTGFFSDFAASFSDVFGGRSQTYQKQLSTINNEVIETLKHKASLLGSNFIVGLRIDHDEISGKSKQMFMVTAYGTAVRALQSKASKSSSDKKTTIVSSEELAISLQTDEIIEKCQTIPINLSEEEWSFVIENQIHQVAPKILESLQEDFIRSQGTGIQPGMKYERSYFLSLPSDISIIHLYEAITKYDRISTFICDTIIQGDLLDYDSIKKLLSSDQFEIQKYALKLAQADKPYYTSNNIADFTKLIEIIKATFPVCVKYIEEKALLSSSIKQKWLCNCGTKNDKDSHYCSKCSKDIYGFYVNEPTPLDVVDLLQSKIDNLSNMFSK